MNWCALCDLHRLLAGTENCRTMLIRVDDGRLFVGRPMPTDPIGLMSGHFTGYAHLSTDEAVFASRALGDAPQLWSTWYRTLNLFDSFFRKDIRLSDVDETGSEIQMRAWEVQLRLCAAAIGAVKMSLEATLVGRYAQGFAMIRFIVQTWEFVEYLKLRPEMATAWVRFEGLPMQDKPSDGTIRRVLEKAGKSKEKDFKDTLNTALAVERRMNGGAHPGPPSLWQTLTTPSSIAFSGTHDERLVHQTWIDGVWAALALAHSMSSLSKFDPDWTTEYIEIQNEYVLHT